MHPFGLLEKVTIKGIRDKIDVHIIVPLKSSLFFILITDFLKKSKKN